MGEIICSVCLKSNGLSNTFFNYIIGSKCEQSSVSAMVKIYKEDASIWLENIRDILLERAFIKWYCYVTLHHLYWT